MKTLMVISGKRKTSVAKVRVSSGQGNVFYNDSPYSHLETTQRLLLDEPIKIYEQQIGKMDYDLYIKTSGGGKAAQIQAARLAIAKALVKLSNSQDLRKAFISYDRNMLVADTRRKEAYKPGDSKARASRQTSYR